MHQPAMLSLMREKFFGFLFPVAILAIFHLIACNNKKEPAAKEIVIVPEQMDEKVKDIISASLNYAISFNGKVDDSVTLTYDSLLRGLYKDQFYSPLWCTNEKWLPQSDSVFNFIEQAKLFGLFPEDYHYPRLLSLRHRFARDSLLQGDRKDAALWARADLMLSDALLKIIKDIKLGRLPHDSITLRKDSVLPDEFFHEKFRAVTSGNPLRPVITSLEPVHKGYHRLKAGIKKFLDSADFRDYAIIKYPNKDTATLKASLVKRLFDAGYLDSAGLSPDSSQLTSVLRKFQNDRGLTADGKIGAQTIRELNSSDREKFIRIAITLDKYKMLPEQMPEKYIWVNIPSFSLKLMNNDTVKLTSRVVVGKPKTRTPVLNSSVYEMITYPQWTIPQSIIVKEILPSLKRDPGYLARKGYSLFDGKGEEVDPFTIDWSKYTKGIPYRIIQGSGDANALGVLKFNFSNKYAVYLHDTNQRFYFGMASRALSHGCVRVQDWEKMAFYLLRNDSLNAKSRSVNGYTPVDSVRHWLAAKEKHVIPVRSKVPIFIRYFSCEGTDEKIVFYEDVYDEDRRLGELYFTGK
jgi:murein L,D-transpeptidase YcbB/YkuD